MSWKLALLLLAGLGLGFLGGAYYVSHDVENAHAIGLSAQAISEDKVLSLLEKNEIQNAANAQRGYLEFTLIQLKQTNTQLPEKVQEIVRRRSANK